VAQAGLRQGELGGACDFLPLAIRLEPLGVETRRQWADKALLRSTPALLGPFSIITLFAHDLAKSQKLKIRTAAWYSKASRPSATRSQRSTAKYHPRDAWRFGCALPRREITRFLTLRTLSTKLAARRRC